MKCNDIIYFFRPTAKTAPLSVPALQATMREPALLSPRLRQQDSSVCVCVCAPVERVLRYVTLCLYVQS